MKILFTGVSGGSGETHEVRKQFAEAMGCHVEDVLVFNQELYTDQTKLNTINRLIIKLGAAWIKSQYGFDISDPTDDAMDRIQDVWLYLNPFWHKTRDLIDDMAYALLKQYPDAEVYAHSLGSVIAYRVISKAGGFPNMKLVTMGSPLWMRLVRQFVDIPPGLLKVKTWQNFWSPHDPIGMSRIPTKLGIKSQDQFNTRTTHDLWDYLAFANRIVE